MRRCDDCDRTFEARYTALDHPGCCRHCATKRDYGTSKLDTCYQSGTISLEDEKPVLLEVTSKDPATQARYQRYVDAYYREEEDDGGLIRR